MELFDEVHFFGFRVISKAIHVNITHRFNEFLMSPNALTHGLNGFRSDIGCHVSSAFIPRTFKCSGTSGRYCWKSTSRQLWPFVICARGRNHHKLVDSESSIYVAHLCSALPSHLSCYYERKTSPVQHLHGYLHFGFQTTGSYSHTYWRKAFQVYVLRSWI